MSAEGYLRAARFQMVSFFILVVLMGGAIAGFIRYLRG